MKLLKQILEDNDIPYREDHSIFVEDLRIDITKAGLKINKGYYLVLIYKALEIDLEKVVKTYPT